MAVAINNYDEIQKESKGYLDISASEFYFNKVRPHIQDMLLTCKTDQELTRTLEKIVNSGDSFCVRKEYQLLVKSFAVFSKVVTSYNYYSGPLRHTEAERNKIEKLSELVSDLTLIVQCEKQEEPTETSTRERLDYIPPIGGIKGEGFNGGHAEHNMKNLTKPIPAKRIPNV